MTNFIKEVRASKNGSLTGLSFDDIVACVTKLVKARESQVTMPPAVRPTARPTARPTVRPTVGVVGPAALPARASPPGIGATAHVPPPGIGATAHVPPRALVLLLMYLPRALVLLLMYLHNRLVAMLVMKMIHVLSVMMK